MIASSHFLCSTTIRLIPQLPNSPFPPLWNMKFLGTYLVGVGWGHSRLRKEPQTRKRKRSRNHNREWNCNLSLRIFLYTGIWHPEPSLPT